MTRSEEHGDDTAVVAEEKEVDFYRNPTVLCRHLLRKRFTSAEDRLKSNPDDASVWVAIYRKDNAFSESSPPSPPEAKQGQKATSSVAQAAESPANKYCLRRLPIHLACAMLNETQHRTQLESILTNLVRVYPEACAKADHEGMLPLHAAIFYAASIEIVAMLLVAYPKSIYMRDGFGRTPVDINRVSVLEKGGATKEHKHLVENALKRGVRFWERIRFQNLTKARQKQQQPLSGRNNVETDEDGPPNPYVVDQIIIEGLRATRPNVDTTAFFAAETIEMENWANEYDQRMMSTLQFDQSNSSFSNLDTIDKPCTGYEEASTNKDNADPRVMFLNSKTARCESISDKPNMMSSFVASLGSEDRMSDVSYLHERISQLENLLTESYSKNCALTDLVEEITQEHGLYRMQIQELKEETASFESLRASEKASKSVDQSLPLSSNPHNDRRVPERERPSSRPNTAAGIDPEVVAYLEGQNAGLQDMLATIRKENNKYQLQVERLSVVVNALKRSAASDRQLSTMIEGHLCRFESSSNSKNDDDDDSLAIELRQRLRSNRNQRSPSRLNCNTEVYTDYHSLLEALSSSSRFGTERFLATKVKDLELKLNTLIQSRESDAASHLEQIEGERRENIVLRNMLSEVTTTTKPKKANKPTNQDYTAPSGNTTTDCKTIKNSNPSTLPNRHTTILPGASHLMVDDRTVEKVMNEALVDQDTARRMVEKAANFMYGQRQQQQQQQQQEGRKSIHRRESIS